MCCRSVIHFGTRYNQTPHAAARGGPLGVFFWKWGGGGGLEGFVISPLTLINKADTFSIRKAHCIIFFKISPTLHPSKVKWSVYCSCNLCFVLSENKHLKHFPCLVHAVFHIFPQPCRLLSGRFCFYHASEWFK